jgi:hypothetical protein
MAKLNVLHWFGFELGDAALLIPLLGICNSEHVS